MAALSEVTEVQVQYNVTDCNPVSGHGKAGPQRQPGGW